MSGRIAIYAGSFNLFHAGHYDVYKKACHMFGSDNVYLCIAINPDKNIDTDFIKWTLNPITPNVIIADGLVVKENPDVLIRGLRDAIDLSAEMTMADWNLKLGCNTIFIPCTGELRHISSSALRELIKHDVKVMGDLPRPIYLSYRRWEKGSLPDRKLFCGKISIGKSTYITDLGMEKPMYPEFGGDCDELIWQFFDKKEKLFIKKQLTSIITSGNMLGYETIISEMAKQIDWHILFSDKDYINFEASALGRWMSYIPYDILCQFQIIELECDMIERVHRAKKRKLSVENINQFDKFYKSPYFVDELIDIT